MPCDLWGVRVTVGAARRGPAQRDAGSFDLRLAPNAQGLFLGDYEALTATATAFMPFYVQTDAATAVASDAFISFPPATAAGAVAHFEARPAPAGTSLTPEGRRRVAERLKLVLAQRRNRAG